MQYLYGNVLDVLELPLTAPMSQSKIPYEMGDEVQDKVVTNGNGVTHHNGKYIIIIVISLYFPLLNNC